METPAYIRIAVLLVASTLFFIFSKRVSANLIHGYVLLGVGVGLSLVMLNLFIGALFHGTLLSAAWGDRSFPLTGLILGYVGQTLGLVLLLAGTYRLVRSLQPHLDAHYSSLVEHSLVGVYLIQDGVLRFVNPRFAEIFGYERKELLSKSFFDLLAPQSRESVARNINKRITGSAQRVHCQLPGLRKSGEVFDAETYGTRTVYRGKPGVHGTLLDITERKRAEEELKRTLSLLAATLESTADGLLVVDREGRMVTFNRKFIEMWRLPEHIVATRDSHQALAFVRDQLEDPEAVLKKLKQLYAEPEAESYDVLECKDGRIFERYSQPQRISGRSVGRVWSFRDITARRRAEEAVLQAQKLESLGVLAGGIAHDFNNLLVGILGNAGLALPQLPPESPARETIGQIEIASLRATDLIKQMLAYSGKCRFVIQRLNLNALVEEMAHLLKVSIAKHVVLKYDFANDLPAVEADATQIRQVAMNLVVNASEAIGDKSGTITISTGAIGANRAYLTETYLAQDLPGREGNYVYLEVADNGCGMDPDTQTKIFDPFFTTKFTGRGLGLAAVLGIVRGHKGSLRVHSKPGHGTTFRILLPSAGAQTKPSSAENGNSAMLCLPGGIVLVVDDEEIVRTVTARMLEQLDFKVLLATEGRAGIETFRTHAAEITCVLLDMTMPHPSGEEVLQEILRHKRDARVILMSGYSEQEATSRFVGKGLAGFLQKPYTPNDLRAKLLSVLIEK